MLSPPITSLRSKQHLRSRRVTLAAINKYKSKFEIKMNYLIGGGVSQKMGSQTRSKTKPKMETQRLAQNLMP